MNKKLLYKCLITLGLLLFSASLLPFAGLFVTTVHAAAVDIGKNDVYRLNLKSVALVKGTTFTLKAYNMGENAKVSFKSDDPEIASVSEDGGIIIANKVGNTVITATIKDETTITPLTCEVLVGPPAFSIKLTKSRIVLGLDKTDYLNVILKPSNTVEDARFSSYDPSIVSVSTGGRITAKKLGLTYIFAEINATNYDGSRKYSRCTVIVTNPEDAPSLEIYLSDHPELDLIPEDDLTKALDRYFNEVCNPTSSTSLVNSLNSYLNDKFDLKKLRADLAKIQSNSLEVVSN